MEEEMDKGKNKEAIDPIMMKEYQIKKIMEKDGKTHSGVPYKYKMNNKKRAIANREDLASDEEEVDYIQVVYQIEEILRETYERKTRGLGLGSEGKTPI
jgi:SPX domain protein involved in polyphosphate accumulation